MTIFLTRDELHELTGLQRPSAQIRWLRARGWPFEISALHEPKVLRAVALARLGGAPRNDDPQPRLRREAA